MSENQQQPSQEQMIVGAVTDRIVHSFASTIQNDPTVLSKIEEARSSFKKTGIYRVIMMETAKMLDELIKILEPHAVGKFEVVKDTLLDYQQKASFASTASLNIVSKDAFHKALETFQRPYKEDGTWLIDGLYTNDPHALYEYLRSDAAPRELLMELDAELSAEEMEKIFELLKKNTSMIVFPTCLVKKAQLVMPGANVYEFWLASLPILMDSVFESVIGRVSSIKAEGASEDVD